MGKPHPPPLPTSIILEAQQARIRQAQKSAAALLSSSTSSPSSLAWLIPSPTSSLDNDNDNDTPTPQQPHSLFPPQEDSLQSHLLSLSLSLTSTAINSRLFLSHPILSSNSASSCWISKDFLARPAEQSSPESWLTLGESMEHWMRKVEKWPELHVRVVEGSVNFSSSSQQQQQQQRQRQEWGKKGEGEGTGPDGAEIFQKLEITGQPRGVVRLGVVVLEWRREEQGRWRCWRMSEFRGG